MKEVKWHLFVGPGKAERAAAVASTIGRANLIGITYEDGYLRVWYWED